MNGLLYQNGAAYQIRAMNQTRAIFVFSAAADSNES